MMMSSGPLVIVVVVGKGNGWRRVEMWTRIVSVSLAFAVWMPERDRLGEQHARQQQ